MEQHNQSGPQMDRSQNAMLAAGELAQEMLPRLESEFPLAASRLKQYIENGFVDPETEEEFDPGERLAAMQAVMDQRDQLDQTELARRMEAIAQGKDIHSGGTPQ